MRKSQKEGEEEMEIPLPLLERGGEGVRTCSSSSLARRERGTNASRGRVIFGKEKELSFNASFSRRKRGEEYDPGHPFEGGEKRKMSPILPYFQRGKEGREKGESLPFCQRGGKGGGRGKRRREDVPILKEKRKRKGIFTLLPSFGRSSTEGTRRGKGGKRDLLIPCTQEEKEEEKAPSELLLLRKGKTGSKESKEKKKGRGETTLLPSLPPLRKKKKEKKKKNGR